MAEPSKSTESERTIDVAPSGAVRSGPPSPASAGAHAELARVDSVGLTRGRKVLALAIAAVSDGVSMFSAFTPPVQIGVDVVTAALLFGVMGFRWPLLPALAVEAVPGLAVFPTWSVAVGVLVGVTPTAPTTPTPPRA